MSTADIQAILKPKTDPSATLTALDDPEAKLKPQDFSAELTEVDE